MNEKGNRNITRIERNFFGIFEKKFGPPTPRHRRPKLLTGALQLTLFSILYIKAINIQTVLVGYITGFNSQFNFEFIPL